jgi:hypothetical protein
MLATTQDKGRGGFRLVKRDDKEWDRVVACEVLIPNIPNCFGDIYTEDAIVEFMIAYQQNPYGIDIEHDNVDVTGSVEVIDMFIADDTTPEFIKGSWVVYCKVHSDEIWEAVLSGEISGYSFQAEAWCEEITIQNFRNREVQGYTEPHPEDGHTHAYLVILDAYNRPISGGTGFTNGHAHTITTHTVTDASNGHIHRYQVIVVADTEEDDG